MPTLAAPSEVTHKETLDIIELAHDLLSRRPPTRGECAGELQTWEAQGRTLARDLSIPHITPAERAKLEESKRLHETRRPPEFDEPGRRDWCLQVVSLAADAWAALQTILPRLTELGRGAAGIGLSLGEQRELRALEGQRAELDRLCREAAEIRAELPTLAPARITNAIRDLERTLPHLQGFGVAAAAVDTLRAKLTKRLGELQEAVMTLPSGRLQAIKMDT